MWTEDHPKKCLFVAYQDFLREESPSDLDWEKVGRVLGLSASDAESLATEAYEFLRVQHVQDHVSAQWSLIKTEAYCVVCGRQAVIKEKGWGWCSDNCYRWLPPSAADTEAQWGVWFREVLEHWKNVSPKILERVTGLNRGMIRWMIWQHLGYDPETQDTKRWVKRKQPLLPNPKIPKVEELIERLTVSDSWKKNDP
jgi:hypothetical protein